MSKSYPIAPYYSFSVQNAASLSVHVVDRFLKNSEKIEKLKKTRKTPKKHVFVPQTIPDFEG